MAISTLFQRLLLHWELQ